MGEARLLRLRGGRLQGRAVGPGERPRHRRRGLCRADAAHWYEARDPDSYTWTPTIAATADYQVYARWTAGPDRAANAEYVVETPSGLDIVTVSQRQGGGAWNLLGTFALEAGSGNRIVLNAAAADGTVVADAVRIVRAVAAGEIAYVHADHLGQPQKLTDATAALLWDRVALPFGATHSEAGLGETSLRFPGQWADAESGLHYNYFRDYDPSLGRYIESDPIGLAGGLNTYAYVHNSPLRLIDSLGLDVYICKRPVDISWLPPAAASVLPQHHWIKTDSHEAGMGGDCPVPGQQCSDKPYSQTRTKDHTGQSSRSNAVCELQQNVDEQCVNNLIAPGTPTGTWSGFNQCQSFTYHVIGQCRYGPQVGPVLPPDTLGERGALGSSYGP